MNSPRAHRTAAGAVWGAVFGFLAHWAARGQRDFAGVSSLRVEPYDVYVDAVHATRYRAEL
jgi:hypothetical protein